MLRSAFIFPIVLITTELFAAEPHFTFEQTRFAYPAHFQNPTGDVRVGNAIWNGESTRPLDLEKANDSGDGFLMQIVGQFNEGPCFQTFANVKGTNYPISRFGGCSTFAYDLNSHGEIVGAADASPADNHPGRHPYLFRNGEIFWLNTLIEGTVRFDYPLKITENGVIYGVRDSYTNWAVVKLTPRADGKYDAIELAQTPTADVKISKTGSFACKNRYWDGEKMVTIADVIEPMGVYPVAVNGHGQILGHADEPDPKYRAFLWEGRIFDLNQLVDLPVGWTLGEPFDLNDYGQILIYAFYPSGSDYERLLLRLTPNPAIRSISAGAGKVTIRVRPGQRQRISLLTTTDLKTWTEIDSMDKPASEESISLSQPDQLSFFLVVRTP